MPVSALAIGTAAPDFELPDQDGNFVRLSAFRGKTAVVLYFYPKDDTRGCTVQACRFRDDFEKFRAAGAEILGISGDSGESHRAFAEKYGLPFRLLSDRDGLVRKLYGVKKRFGVIPGRVTFVIDRGGILRFVFSSLSEPVRHVDEALASVGG